MEPKAKVNISTITDRDTELRNVTETLVGALLRNVLDAPATKRIVADTLSGKRSSVNEDAPSTPPVITKTTYGVYFKEITTVPALHRKVVLVFKQRGHAGYDTSGLAMTEQLSAALHGAPQEWRGKTEEWNIPDEYSYQLTVHDLRDALHDVGIDMILNNSLYRAFENAMTAQAKGIPGKLAVDPETNELIALNNLVCVTSLVYSLSDAAKIELDSVINAVMDKKRFDEKVSIHNGLPVGGVPLEETPEATPEGPAEGGATDNMNGTSSYSRPPSALPLPPSSPGAVPPKPGSPSVGLGVERGLPASVRSASLAIDTDLTPSDDGGSVESIRQEEVNMAFRKDGFVDTAQTILAEMLFDAIKSVEPTVKDWNVPTGTSSAGTMLTSAEMVGSPRSVAFK